MANARVLVAPVSRSPAVSPKETGGPPEFPDYPFAHMPRSQTPVVSRSLAFTRQGLLPSARCTASAFRPVAQTYPLTTAIHFPRASPLFPRPELFLARAGPWLDLSRYDIAIARLPAKAKRRRHGDPPAMPKPSKQELWTGWTRYPPSRLTILSILLIPSKNNRLRVERRNSATRNYARARRPVG